MRPLSGFYEFKIYAMVKKKGNCFNCLPWTSTGGSHWEVFHEINLNRKTLKLYIYLFSAFKERVQVDYSKTCSVMGQAWISIFC